MVSLRKGVPFSSHCRDKNENPTFGVCRHLFAAKGVEMT